MGTHLGLKLTKLASSGAQQKIESQGFRVLEFYSERTAIFLVFGYFSTSFLANSMSFLQFNSVSDDSFCHLLHLFHLFRFLVIVLSIYFIYFVFW